MNHSFHSYEEENIHYWSNRASGYSDVNKEELTSNQKVYGLLFLTNAFKSIFKIEIEQTFMFLISALVLDFLPSF